MRQALSSIFILVLSSNRGVAQSFDLGSWNILNIKYNMNDKWSLFGEAQLRSLKFYSNFHYYEFKGGVNYKFHKNAAVSLGAGSYQTYKEGGSFVLPKNNSEFRIWPQMTLFQSLGKVNIEQRYRTELRFTSNGYQNRFRYRLGLAYPFGKERSNYRPYQITTSNELFFTDKEPYFQRNRILVAFNYKPSKSTVLQTGYLHQFDYRINDETGRDFLLIGLLVELFHKQSTNKRYDMDLQDN